MAIEVGTSTNNSTLVQTRGTFYCELCVCRSEWRCWAGMVDVIPSRVVRSELRDRYESEGWWTPETSGALLSSGVGGQP